MNLVITQQVALDNALVAPEKQLKIERCNARIEFSKPQREETYQVILEALKLSPYYLAFLITAKVLEIYMHYFKNTIRKIRNSYAYNFKLDKKKFQVDTKRTFAAIISRCIFWKTTGLDRLMELLAQILWGMCNQKNVDYVALLWEDFMYQADNKEISLARKEHMSYPRFTKVIINHFKVLKQSKEETHKVHATDSSEGVGFQPKVLDKHEDKTAGTDEGTDTKPEVPDVPTYEFESENKSWGDSQDDESNDGDNDDNDEEEKTQDDEYVRTPDYYVPTDEESRKENREFDEEEYDDLYKDVNIKPKDTEPKKKTGSSKKSSSVSSDFASKFLNLYNVPPTESKVASLMNVKTHQEDSSTQAPLPPPPLLTVSMTTILETSTNVTIRMGISQFKHVDHSAKLLATVKQKIPTIVDDLLSTRIGFATQTALQSYNAEFKKKSQEKKDRYIDVIEKSIKYIINYEIKNQLPQILPKEVSDFATSVIQSTVTKSLKNVVLAKSSSQSQSTYEDATSLTEFELKKILLDKLEKSKSYRATEQHKDLYDTLVKSYHLDMDLFYSYGKAYSLKRDREDKDKDKDPLAGSDQGLKKKKASKDVEPSKGSKSKDSKSSSSKGTKTQPKSSGKSTQAEEPVFEVADTEMPQNQGTDVDQTIDQLNVKPALKHDWFKKPKRPLVPGPDWNARKMIDFRPPQTWISRIAQTEKPPLTFDELINTPIDFSAYVMNNLKLDNLTQQHFVEPAFNLLKGTCKSRVELEYHFEECYKVVNDRLDWTNLEGQEYPFDLSKPLPNSMDSQATGYPSMMCTPERESFQLLMLSYEVKKISNLERDVIFDLNVALQMFTRRVVIQKRVEDLQLGVESYQKKLNITSPETFRSNIPNKTPYTAYNNPHP
nr:hypothetical protein [Tanacetum cinerariifolium]